MKKMVDAADDALSEQLDYLLRRAEQESIAAIRSPNLIAAERHNAIAQAYSAQALMILADVPGPTNGGNPAPN